MLRERAVVLLLLLVQGHQSEFKAGSEKREARGLGGRLDLGTVEGERDINAPEPRFEYRESVPLHIEGRRIRIGRRQIFPRIDQVSDECCTSAVRCTFTNELGRGRTYDDVLKSIRIPRHHRRDGDRCRACIASVPPSGAVTCMPKTAFCAPQKRLWKCSEPAIRCGRSGFSAFPAEYSSTPSRHSSFNY
ncbi:hypothetical protein B0H11DRAFT_1922819 [Mycena galericulata]|nr:hypothetical protein B0H11DRAFT_1922819 [Mycena galericulata]